MKGPKLLPTSAQGETFAGVTYHLDGELVPVLTVELTPNRSIFFEHHTLLWKDPNVEITTKSLRGGFKRMMAGLPIIMTEARGQGHTAFSRDGVGHIFPIHLSQGHGIHVREHQFLAATDNIDYTYERIKGLSNIMFGGNSFFIDEFRAINGDGILWLHGYGNVFEVELAAGEQLDVEPGAWLYKTPSLKMETNLMRLATSMFAGSSFTMNRFTGPGRLAIQSMGSPFHTGGFDTSSTDGAKGIGLMAILSGLFGKR